MSPYLTLYMTCVKLALALLLAEPLAARANLAQFLLNLFIFIHLIDLKRFLCLFLVSVNHFGPLVGIFLLSKIFILCLQLTFGSKNLRETNTINDKWQLWFVFCFFLIPCSIAIFRLNEIYAPLPSTAKLCAPLTGCSSCLDQ